VSQATVDAAYEADPSRAAAEFGAIFRTDVETFAPREVIEAAIVPGRFELSPVAGTKYFAAVDPAGGAGAGDSMTLAIAYRDANGHAVLACIREARPPFSPAAVVDEFSAVLATYGIRTVTGDKWGGGFVQEPFHSRGVTYELADRPKSDFYRDVLPLLTSSKAELLDHRRMVSQLVGLERRTARGGRDSIDHAPGSHDDICNVVAIAMVMAAAGAPAIIWDMGMVRQIQAAGAHRGHGGGGMPAPYQVGERAGFQQMRQRRRI
jgi:hypothetical protein